MAADKARFYLEKAVPELKEYEKKGVFTKVIALFLRQHIRPMLTQRYRMRFVPSRRSGPISSTKSMLPVSSRPILLDMQSTR
jgi:hypothetical protein